MTIENSDDTVRSSASEPAEPLPAEPSSVRATALEEDVDLSVLEAAPPAASTSEGSSAFEASSASEPAAIHDSVAPLSRKLAPPPKPRRDSAPVSGAPSARPASETGIDSVMAASALKAPMTPTIISYSADGASRAPANVENAPEEPASDASALAPISGSAPPLSAPPPIPRRRSNPSIAALGRDEVVAIASARSPSGPVVAPLAELTLSADLVAELAAKPASNPPRPVATPPRPDPAPARAGSSPMLASSAVPRPRSDPSLSPSSAPPSQSAIFAMRIIAVGESQPPPPVQADHSADPTAYPAALGTRRSSRPAPGSPPAAAPAPLAPLDSAPDIEIVDLLPGAEAAPAVAEAGRPAPPVAEAGRPAPAVAEAVPAASPVVDAAPAAAATPAVSDAAPAAAATPAVSDAAVPVADAASASVTGVMPVVPMPQDVTAELSEDDLAPDSGERKTTATPEVEELGREDAISVPPEELAAFIEAQEQAKADAKPPPPPPKRAAGASPSVPTVDPAAARPAPPTPDPAAAKAAQRAKTRQPWWEDLFNEDFMRGSAKVNEEQVRREVTFIEDSLGVAAGGIVLDLGCGAGHHAVELASRGYGVVGYDLSLYQLALAADVAQERSQKINFLQGDMREMAFEEMFDGVFCWNTTFGYFEEDKNLAVAQRVFKALRPGGMFLIDVLNRDFAAASSPQQVWYEGDSCVCMDDMSVDYISSRLRVKRSIILDDGRTKESLFSLRLYSLHELGKLLHEVGFRVTEASGHPATPGVFFGPNSPRIIMLAQRP